MLLWTICIIAAYLIGSIPFGVLIARSRGVDIREHGSRNIGATNVGRVLGKRFGIVCFLLDVAKGAASVIGAGLITGVFGQFPDVLLSVEVWSWLAVAASAVLGHMYSIFLRFAGGKGVATSFGALVSMWPLLTLPTLAALGVWIVTVKAARMVSLASIIAAIALPIGVIVQTFVRRDSFAAVTPLLVVTILLALLVVYKHRANLKRIAQGVEPKIGKNSR